MRFSAVRGATTVPANTAEEIAAAAAELLDQLMARNGLSTPDLISVIFTATPDLDAGFPATGARRIGLHDVALLCATEIGVPGSLERCIRVLVHVNLPEGKELRPVYLRGSRDLRSDLDHD